MKKLGGHTGIWVDLPKLVSQYRHMNEEGELTTATKEEIFEGAFLEFDGIWFQVFLSDLNRQRYFLEVIS